MFLSGQAQAQRAGENAVAEADDAFGTVVGDEEIGLYSSSSARGFNPSQAGNLRINGLYFDQAAAPNIRMQRGSTIHVGISAQGYPLPAPTGVVDYKLRTPGDEFVTSVQVEHGAIFSYPRHLAEIDTQIPVVDGILNIGGGFGYERNNAHQNAVKNTRYNAGLLANWTPNEALSVIPFWSFMQSRANGGDRPKIYLGDNKTPKFRSTDQVGSPWVFFGFRHYNYGVVSQLDLPDRWTLRAGLFRSEYNNPTTMTAFLLNTDENGIGDYVIQAVPERFTDSTSGELRLSKSFRQGGLNHTFHMTTRARNRKSVFGGADLLRFGTAEIGNFPELDQPDFQTTPPTGARTQQVTGAIAYEGLWQGVGQITTAIQKTDYERRLTPFNGTPVEGGQSPWLYNAAVSAFLSPRLTAYVGYTRGLEEVGTAPGNAVNNGEAVPAQLTRQIDAGLRYQIRPGLQFVSGLFQIDKPYFGLDTNNVYRRLGDIRHSGIELSLAGSLTENLTTVAGAVFLQPRITDTAATGGTTKLTAVGPVPRLIRVNMQYRVPSVEGLAFDAEIESVSGRYLTVSNSHRISGAVTIDAGVRYTTTISEIPVRLQLQGFNLTNSFSVTPSASGQITPFEPRRVELSVAADF